MEDVGVGSEVFDMAGVSFLEINVDNVLLGLKVTSQLPAYLEMVLRSLLRRFPA